MADEKNFENRVKEFLKSENCWFVKYFANRMTKRGIPDLLCCINGFFVGVEVKAMNGKPSEIQLWNKEQIEKSGGISLILYPDDFEDFKDLVFYLKGIKNENKPFKN